MLKFRLVYYNLIVSFITLLMIDLFDLREAYGLMLVYSLNSAFVFAFLIREEIVNFKGLSINLLLLTGYILRLVLPSVSKSIDALDGKHFAFLLPQNDVTDYMFPTVVWMNIYYMIFYWCVLKWGHHLKIEDKLRPIFLKWEWSKLTVPMFIIGLIYKIIVSYLPAGVIPQFVSSIFGQMVVIAIFGQMFNVLFRPSGKNRNIFFIFLVLSTWQSMFFGFYKSAIMMNLIYYLLYYFLDCKYHHKRVFSSKFIIGCGMIFLIIDLVVYPFMTTKRIISGWDVTEGAIATKEFSNIDILLDVIKGDGKHEIQENSATDRLDAIPANAFFYKECCVRGIRTSQVAINNIELLVPRFLNPNKHNSQAGLMVYAYATTGSFNNYDSAVSNNYIGQFASAYLIGGALMALLLAFVNGWFIAMYYNFLLKRLHNLFAMGLLFPLLMTSLLAFEEIHDGGFLSMGYKLAMMLILLTLMKFFPGFLNVKTK